MTRSEYHELVDFLGQRFGRIDGRLDAIEGRLARVEVGQEADRHRLQLLAEGIAAVNQRLERHQRDTAEEFRAVREEMVVGLDAVRAEMAEGLGAVRAEMAEGLGVVRAEMAEGQTSLRAEMAEGFRSQGKLIQDLTRRMDRWERRFA